MKKTFQQTTKYVLLNAACLAGLLAAPAFAQDANDEEIVVTGFRASLTSSTNAKRDSTAFTDSVFAEDIGKFPDTNIAESLNRIPGIVINREVNGEGLNIAIRGLGTNFTKTLLNGANVSVASSGQFDAQNTNREVDLDLFPSELFARLDVNKSPQASILEGGVAGTVNLRTVRPFDNPGTHFTYSIQGQYGELNEEWSPRLAGIASWTSPGGTFGALIGVSYVDNKYETQGYETIGYTNPNLSWQQAGVPVPAPVAGGAVTPSTNPCGTVAQNPAGQPQNPAYNPATCYNSTGGNGFSFANTAPVGTGSGIAPGTIIDSNWLLANNPGMTIEQISNAIFPRLGRPAHFGGTRERLAGVVSLQYRPNEHVDAYLDIMGSIANRDTNRRDLMWEVRNSNFMIPMNMVVDENNVLQSGDFAHSRLFLEARAYKEDLDFVNLNPGVTFTFDDVRIDAQANYGHSVFFREAPTVGLTSNLDAGVRVQYQNNGAGAIPTFTSVATSGLNGNAEFDPNNPDAGWVYIRLNLQNEKRVTTTQGLHFDVTWGDERNNLRAGIAYDGVGRTIRGFNNDAAWEDFTCRAGGDPDGSGAAPRPGCVGGPGSAITQAELGDYLIADDDAGFVDVDYDKFFADSNYETFFNAAPLATGAATGATSGLVDEDTYGFYVEANGESEWRDHTLRFNAGARYVNTDQVIASLARPPGQPNGPLSFRDRTLANYDAFLPALNVVAEVLDNVSVRFSGSRTLTRANPNAMLPNTTFSDPSAQQANQGNPDLAPFLSNNFDIGGEWYTGGEGYFGVALFNKQVTGFTVTGTTTRLFTDLGIDFASLSETQQIAINNRGGPNVATVTVNQQVNAGGVLNVRGYELTWVQPLDFLLEGAGFTANYTRINQSGEGSGAPAIATNVPRYTYASTLYYENYGFSGRVSYVYNDMSQQTGSPQDGFGGGTQPQAGQRYNVGRGQWDASFSYTIEPIPSSPRITLDLINITNEPREAYQGYENAVYTLYDPGYAVLLGVRGTF